MLALPHQVRLAVCPALIVAFLSSVLRCLGAGTSLELLLEGTHQCLERPFLGELGAIVTDGVLVDHHHLEHRRRIEHRPAALRTVALAEPAC